MKGLIRTDLSSQIGMGHAVRCKALAQALAARGAEVCFTTTTPGLETFVAPFLLDECVVWHSYDVLIVDTKASDWTQDTIALWLARDAGLRVVCIDHTHATHDTCDLLVAPVAHWDDPTVARLRGDFGERFLYGWDYVLIDEAVTQHLEMPSPESAVQDVEEFLRQERPDGGQFSAN